MNVLFLDTASAENMLALCTENKTLHLQRLSKHGDAELVPAIEESLKKVGWTYKDLTHLACVIGPGGFTSLRIGVTAVNTLAYALRLPVSGVHLCDIWERRIMRDSGFLWLHSTRRTQIFVKGYGVDGTITPTGTFDLEEVALLKGPYVGELLPEHEKLLTQCTRIPEEKLSSIEEMLPKFLVTLKYQKQELRPWYGRGI